MKVVQFGYSRSGTTLICRILSRLLNIKGGDAIFKTHYYAPQEMRDNLTIVSVRDMRDALISHYRASYDAHHGRPPVFPLQRGELDEMVKGTVVYLEENFWPTIASGRCFIVKYETFYRDIKGAIAELCTELKCPYPDNVDQVVADCSMETVKRLTFGLPSFKQVGPEGLHGNHIVTPDPGYWKFAFAHEDHAPVTQSFYKFLEHYGYDTSSTRTGVF